MAGAAGGFVTRAFEAMLKECSANRGKFAALQQSIQSYLDSIKGAAGQEPQQQEDGKQPAEGGAHHAGVGVGRARAGGDPGRVGAAAATPTPHLRDQARQARRARARLPPCLFAST